MNLKEYAQKKVQPGRGAAAALGLASLGPLGAEKGKFTQTLTGMNIGQLLGVIFPALGVGLKAGLSGNKIQSLREGKALAMKSWPILMGLSLGGAAGSYLGHGPNTKRKK